MNERERKTEPIIEDEASSEQLENKNPGAIIPTIGSVYRYLTFGLSLPERTLRSTSAMVGGVLRESTELLVPQAFRSSKSYSIFVTQMLDFMSEDIGGVQKNKEDPSGSEKTGKEDSAIAKSLENVTDAESGRSDDESNSSTDVENYVARKTVGNFIELAGMATLHLSPITILAVFSDIAYGSKTYLKELAEELKREGVIGEDSTINNATDLLDAVSDASGTAASAFDLPPLSAEGLKNTINETREAVGKVDPTKLIPQAELARLWQDMRSVADKEHVNIFEVSSAMTLYTLNQVTTVGKGALSSIRVAGSMLDQHIFRHYVDGLKDINEVGLYQSLSKSAKPYLDAVWTNFSTEKSTWTEDLFSGKLAGQAWQGFKGWFKKS